MQKKSHHDLCCLLHCRYGDAVIELDSGVGMILQKLKSLGIDKDTLVIFSSDNGGATYAKEQGIIRKSNTTIT